MLEIIATGQEYMGNILSSVIVVILVILLVVIATILFSPKKGN